MRSSEVYVEDSDQYVQTTVHDESNCLRWWRWFWMYVTDAFRTVNDYFAQKVLNNNQADFLGVPTEGRNAYEDM